MSPAAEAMPPAGQAAAGAESVPVVAPRRWARFPGRTRFSLTGRVLTVNLLVVAFLGGGMLYLDRYERGLIQTELQALQTQGGLFAGALGEGAVLQSLGDEPVLVPSLAEGMMRRLVEPARIRARLFLADGEMIADSRMLQGRNGVIEVEPLPPPGGMETSAWDKFLNFTLGFLRDHNLHPAYIEHAHQEASDYQEVMGALDGRSGTMVRTDLNREDGDFVLSVAVPVHHYRLVLGAVMLSVGSSGVEKEVAQVRKDILRLFAGASVMTALLSIYLASTIARPVRRLAQAANAVRRGNGRKIDIPDFSSRRDEIGELSIALTDMTNALWRRMDAIERFAADVAHEIKNPLSSLRSAVETAARVEDPARRAKLMAIVHDDVQRLDRLISDISDASRLDAEMSRLERVPVNLTGMLAMLVQLHNTTREEGDTEILFDGPPQEGPLRDDLNVQGKEGRLVQVFRNLIANALSFSPPGGTIRLRAVRERGQAVVTIDDDGPGIPDGKLTAIFDRFYSERPAGEKFGTHSGLGLSISKQIVDAHGGSISAENRLDDAGKIIGARFIVRLPAGGS